MSACIAHSVTCTIHGKQVCLSEAVGDGNTRPVYSSRTMDDDGLLLMLGSMRKVVGVYTKQALKAAALVLTACLLHAASTRHTAPPTSKPSKTHTS